MALQQPTKERPLGHYRIIELPGVAPMIFGKTFADLGAEVIKIEPPEGDESRQIPPFLPGRADQDAGIFWNSYGLGKRSVVADLRTAEGKALFLELVAGADVVVESFQPGELDRLGLGYEQLKARNPGIVLTSISSFGQTGPYSQWRGSDLVHFAMSGYLYMTGSPDDRPIKPSAPFQTSLHGSIHAVGATLLALRLRKRTGEGCHIDQALRDTGSWMLTHTYQFFDMQGTVLRRQGAARDMGGYARLPMVYHSKDGLIVWMLLTGHIGARSTAKLVEWMGEHDMAPEWLQEIDWTNTDLLRVGNAILDNLRAPFEDFFREKTSAELLAWAIPNGVMLAPVQTIKQLASDPHLAARDAWRDVSADGISLRVPGPPARMTDSCWEPRGAAPSLGEANDEVQVEVLN